ncbi:MAG: hypothetical protein SNJ66_11560 [Chloroherpetonaceae bacterium]
MQVVVERHEPVESNSFLTFLQEMEKIAEREELEPLPFDSTEIKTVQRVKE